MHCITSLAVLTALVLAPAAEAAGFYGKNSPVLEVTGKNFDKLIKNSDKASMVEFYAPWCGHCQNLKPAYEKAAKALEGLANVAAVNCDDDENKGFCSQMGIKGFPTLKTVRVTGTPGKPIIRDYTEGRSASDIVTAVKGLIPNIVKRVEDKDLEEWLAEKNETAKAILFSDKGTTSALIRVLANEYVTNMDFAQIRKKEEGAVSMFGVTTFPTLVVLPGGTAPAVVYEGKMEKAPMNEFLSQYAALYTPPKKEKKTKSSKENKKATSSSESSFSEASASHKSAEASAAAASASTITIEEPDTPTSSPAPILDDDAAAATPVPIPDVAPSIPYLETYVEIQKHCLGPKTQTCVLALLPTGTTTLTEISTEALASLAELAKKHKQGGRHLFPFFAIPSSNAGSAALISALGLDTTSKEVQLVAVNGRRGWWRLYDGAEKGFGAMAVEGWVDGIRFDEGAKEKLPEGLVVEEAEAGAAGAETESSSTETAAAESATAEAETKLADGKQEPIHIEL